MLSDSKGSTVIQDLEAQLTKARRDLRVQEQRLAQLKYEWGIAKRLRTRAHNEDEREKSGVAVQCLLESLELVSQYCTVSDEPVSSKSQFSVV